MTAVAVIPYVPPFQRRLGVGKNGAIGAIEDGRRYRNRCFVVAKTGRSKVSKHPHQRRGIEFWELFEGEWYASSEPTTERVII